MRQKKKTHRASSVGLQVGSSDKRRHLAGVLTATDLFTVEHLVARHHSGSCRTVWTLMPARYLAKARRHLGCRSHMPGLYEEY